MSRNAAGDGGSANAADDTGNGGDGGDGGGIYSAGTLTMVEGTVGSNTTGHGGSASDEIAPDGGAGGTGGGICNTGTLTLNHGTAISNTASAAIPATPTAAGSTTWTAAPP